MNGREIRKISVAISLMMVVVLSGCGKASEETTDASTELVIEDIAEQEYPQIAYVDNVLYYGTNEKCEMVPRKAPDGTIETFVSKEIMPDAYNSANFGEEQGKMEYMFVEDGRLIVHIGEDWYYFENQSEGVAMGNPWVITDAEGVFNATGFSIKAPEGATDVQYSYCEPDKLAEVTYTLNGADWVYRVKASSELEDISGLYYDWIFKDEGMVSGKKAIYMAYSDATEDTEYIDDVNSIQVVNWFDDVNGASYSLSASGTDLNGMDIQVYAEQLYNN